MDIINNALSAKNVKIHGMSSSKWTTKDKITQYKGLVNLYKRDREITQIDTAVAAKRQYKGLINLRKTIENNRRELDNAVGGDRQQLRNILADHRELQLAYQNTDPKKVIEYIHQVNFTKRKVLDKLDYQMKQKAQQLVDLKLEEALLSDRLKYEHYDKLEMEKEAQRISGKVQNAFLKKEAALAIQQTYSQIIDVMKKDLLYFDSVLSTIQNDYWYQCRCILNATKQGQLATEYKNDREQEFETLEYAVMQDLKTQKNDLQKVHEEAENLQANLKYLLRRDSDLTTCVIKVQDTNDVTDLYKDLSKIESTLKTLQSKTLVASFEQIYPSLEEQLRQKKRLRALAKKCERDKDIMLNKLNHAETMNNVLETTMVETTGDYKKRKTELLELIEEENQKKKQCNDLQTYKQDLIAKIRISLRQLQQLCKGIKAAEEKNIQQEEKNIQLEEKTSLFIGNFVDVAPPEEDEIDGLTIISGLIPKVTFLTNQVTEKLTDSKLDTAFKHYELIMKDRLVEVEKEVTTTDDFLEGFSTEVAQQILTREDIKKQSEAIVAAHSKDEDLVPIFPIKKKRKFK